MKIGTRSVLFGAHAFWHYPIAVALGWAHLYGWTWHPLRWVAFVVHDIGYFGKPNMDGPEGEQHPVTGATFMLWLTHDTDWYKFCLHHSRHFAKLHGAQPSRLCYADKLAICFTPAWLYLACTWASGELKEYMAMGKVQAGQVSEICGPHVGRMISSDNPREWFKGLRVWTWTYVNKFKDGSTDSYTVLRNHK